MPSFLTRLALRGAALGTGLVFGCVAAGGVSATASYQYFSPPAAEDAWTGKIGEWQSRARSARPDSGEVAPASVSGGEAAAGSGPALREKFERFRREQRRGVAREVAEWIQREARAHYRPDGPLDHWATLEETLASDSEDCDGLELVASQLLRDLGFDADEVYRAIVYRPSDGQHHMVTFWFESRTDPWVIDPTGAMTTGMPRMSEMIEWVPLKVFSQDEEFTVRPRPVASIR